MISSSPSSGISSSYRTSEKPCFLKDSALSIWSPLLALADSGMSTLGILRAKSSQIALAPALESAMSVHLFTYVFKLHVALYILILIFSLTLAA